MFVRDCLLAFCVPSFGTDRRRCWYGRGHCSSDTARLDKVVTEKRKTASRTEQNRTEQNRTEQNRTEQNRTEPNRAADAEDYSCCLLCVFVYARVGRAVNAEIPCGLRRCKQKSSGMKLVAACYFLLLNFHGQSK